MTDIGIRDHQEWLGLIQPVGLVVVPAALVDAQIILDTSERERWTAYGAMLVPTADGEGLGTLLSFQQFASRILEWPLEAIAGAGEGPPLPESLSVSLPEAGETLEPTLAVPDPDSPGAWHLLVKEEAPGIDLDQAVTTGSHWAATPHERFERLLRETGVGLGLLTTDKLIRLVYAPKGESSGYLTFPVAAMATSRDRPMFQALVELLKWWRLSVACPTNQRLPHVLRESRRYQNQVSNELAEQVLGALYELARGMQAADDAAGGTVMQETLREAPAEVYGGLLTTIMRIVFVLFAEERGMLPSAPAWVENYGIGALFVRLRNDHARHTDIMDQRFSAWPQLLTLFRILHDGARHGGTTIPARHGDLFDPDLYPFLEGRPWGTRRVLGDRLEHVPRVADGTILRVLDRLLMLKQERLSYRALDVEQIGSVYEAMMGFEVQAARGRSIAVKPKTKKAGSPSHQVVNLDELLATPSAERSKHLKEIADCEPPPDGLRLLVEAATVEELQQALAKRTSPYTPFAVRRGGLVLIPTEERRRSGSHYTPRELTEPIVVTTLRPVLEALGKAPTPDQLLGLRVCDPAMGSAAFLVAACRHLGDLLVGAWQRTGTIPTIPPDEDPQLYARRLVAQQCLYGVDRNPYAVQLGKLSLWLVTLAKDHPFTFIDHALRCGDSLVGLTRSQLEAFHWDPKAAPTLWVSQIESRVRSAEAGRIKLEALATSDDTGAKAELLDKSDQELGEVRLIGDSAVAAFFGAEKPKAREVLRKANEGLVAGWLGDPTRAAQVRVVVEQLREGKGVRPFHWEVEFPEVFRRENPGFDAIVGNPPFAGKNTLINSNPAQYLDWLQQNHAGAHGNSDLVAHFFRRAFSLLRKQGAFGLIATNTIAQGDTRATGLRWLRQNGCTIYEARRRYRWPGVASVVVSVVHGVRGQHEGPYRLDGRDVPVITAFLFHAGGDNDPAQLAENAGKSFQGSIILGMGFTFDDTSLDATPIAEMERLIAVDARNADVILPYIGGDEVNDTPTHAFHRYVINFGAMSLEEASNWPSLLEIVRRKVKPIRDIQKRPALRERWWQYAEKRPGLQAATAGLARVLATNCGATPQFALAFLPVGMIYANTLAVMTLESDAAFAVLQSRPHEIWARFFGSSMKDDLRYTPSDCFETFPFPVNWESDAALEESGREYQRFRRELMIASAEGLTETYNRFNDPTITDPSIVRLRDLHARMDRAALNAFGWNDIASSCEFVPEFDDGESGSVVGGSQRSRFRWPDAVRDEVLARLLALNTKRAAGSPVQRSLL